MRRFLVIIFIFTFSLALGQKKDSLGTEPLKIAAEKVIKADTLIKKHSPQLALYMSALVPGLGQVYNHQWLHIPVIYAALAYTFYNYNIYRVQYWMARNDIISAMNNIDYTLTYNKTTDINQLLSIKESYRSRRDLSFLMFVGAWTLNVLDAYVGAEFYDFDVSDDLSLRFVPTVIPLAKGQNFGLSFVVNF